MIFLNSNKIWIRYDLKIHTLIYLKHFIKQSNKLINILKNITNIFLLIIICIDEFELSQILLMRMTTLIVGVATNLTVKWKTVQEHGQKRYR